MTKTPFALAVDIEHAGDYDHQNPKANPTPHILEIGLRVVDGDLATIAEESWVIPWGPTILKTLRRDAHEIVRKMHTTSGLWDESLDLFRDRRFVDRRLIRDQIIKWVVRELGDAKIPLLGSSVQHDRNWLLGWASPVGQHLTHRIIDVSTIKGLVQAWNPDVAASRPTPQARHRVMPDLDDTVAELAHYRPLLQAAGVMA